jgi:hypothetical protein
MSMNKDYDRCIDLDNIDLVAVDKKIKEREFELRGKIRFLSIFTILKKLIDSQFSKVTDLKKVDKRTELFESTLRKMHIETSLSKDINDER